MGCKSFPFKMQRLRISMHYSKTQPIEASDLHKSLKSIYILENFLTQYTDLGTYDSFMIKKQKYLNGQLWFYLLCQLSEVTGWIWSPSKEAFIHDYANRPEINSGIILLLEQYLRGHIKWRPSHGAVLVVCRQVLGKPKIYNVHEIQPLSYKYHTHKWLYKNSTFNWYYSLT